MVIFQNNTITLIQVLGICFGNMFQEYNNRKQMMTKGKKSIKLHFMWIIATTFLSMAFVGNLKSALVQKNYESRTFTVSEMIDKDMNIFVPDTFIMFLENDSSDSSINKRILCQIKKTRKQIQ